jgi:hypothetical protein
MKPPGHKLRLQHAYLLGYKHGLDQARDEIRGIAERFDAKLAESADDYAAAERQTRREAQRYAAIESGVGRAAGPARAMAKPTLHYIGAVRRRRYSHHSQLWEVERGASHPGKREKEPPGF